MDDPRRAYSQQKYRAKKRGIGFNLSFDQWWDIWKESGCYPARGRNGYVMHRKGDRGEYEVGNVEIISATENFRIAMDTHYGGERSYRW
jgi:hypothetical protein